MGRYSDSLWAGLSGDLTPVGASFSAPVQTGPGAYPASCTMSTRFFPEVKRTGYGADHSPHLSAEVLNRVQLYLYSPFGPSWPVIGRTYLSTYLMTSRSHKWTHCSEGFKPNVSINFTNVLHFSLSNCLT